MWDLGMRDGWLLQGGWHVFGSACEHETMSLSLCQADQQGTNLRRTHSVCILLNGGFQSLWMVWKVECSPEHPTERALSMLWVLVVDTCLGSLHPGKQNFLPMWIWQWKCFLSKNETCFTMNCMTHVRLWKSKPFSRTKVWHFKNMNFKILHHTFIVPYAIK